jgi:ABC-type lipoprotein export system ATPase subunit
MAALIELKNISKSYTIGRNEISILSGLNLVFDRGEFVAITGPSGSGKTTLLNILGGIDEPTDGQYLFDGTIYRACRTRH